MSTWKKLTGKIPRWCWYVFPVAILLFLAFALRDGGRGALRWLSPPSPHPSRPPAPITPKEGEKLKEEIRKASAGEVEQLELEQDEIKGQVDNWLQRLE